MQWMCYVGEGLEGTEEMRVPPKEWRFCVVLKLFLLVESMELDKIGEEVKKGVDPQGTPK